MTEKLGSRADTHENVKNIQADINRIVNGTDTWQMTFNVAKCKVMHIGKANINTDNTKGFQIETIDTQKDLGILISSDLKTTKHCIEVEKNAIAY